MNRVPDLPVQEMSGALHVALVTETWPPEINGVAHTLHHMAQGLLGRGHSVHLLRPRQGRGDQGGPELPGLTEQVLPGLPIPGYSGLHFGLPARGAISRAWRAATPDVVYLATEGPLGHSALAAARSLGVPVVSGFHTNFHSYSRYYRLGFLEPAVAGVLRRFHNRTDCTLVPTEHLRAELMGQGFRNCAVLARGVNTRLYNPSRRDEELRRSWGVEADAPVVLYVGRLAAEKNLGLAVEAFRALQAHCPAARFVLVGDGPAGAELKRQHPDFVFCGMRTGEDLARHYASGDVFMFASTSETFGNVVLEAMASGLAIVAYDYAAAREHLRDGHSAALAQLHDAQGYVARARALAEQPERIRALGAAARARSLSVDWDHIYDGLESLLRAHAWEGRANGTAAAHR